MANTKNTKRLGRGLAALIGDDTSEDASVESARSFRRVPIEFLKPNPNNPRKNFNTEDLEDLSNSIRQKGLLQPIVVRPVKDTGDDYEIVAGERRWRAAQQAALHDVPILIRELTDAEALEIAIVENVQRSDLNPIEEAEGYSKLLDQFNYSQKQLAKMVGKSRSHIANTLRLTKLPEKVRGYLVDGQLTAGHARTLVSSDQPEALAEQIIRAGMTVRDAERITQKKPKTAKTANGREPKDADTIALERNLSQTLGLAVDISDRKGVGELRIRYRSLEQLDEICTRLLRLK